jgi:hypothetical protein
MITGSRSIINNLVFHPDLPLIATSGVEKTVRVFSPFPLSNPDDFNDDSGGESGVKRPSRPPRRMSNYIFYLDGEEESLEEDTGYDMYFVYMNV